MSNAIKELDVVVLLEDVTEDRLEAGMTGTVLEVFDEGEVFLVEFVATNGRTHAMPTLSRRQVLPLREVPAEAA